MTVEAALILPIVLFAMLSVIYIGLMIQCQDEVQWALIKTAKEISAEYGATEKKELASTVYCQAKMSKNLGKNIVSFSMLESSIMEDNDEIDLIINYRIKTPFSMFASGGHWFRQRVRTRAFVGVESREQGKREDVIVYITPTGHVYHRDKQCTYLKLSISQMKYRDLASLRNESGGKYKECEHCSLGKTPTDDTAVWITNYGDRYHLSRACSNIKRDIKEIFLSKVGKRTPCSKCGNK